MNVTLFLENLRRTMMSALLGSIALLTACGGGGGGGTTTTYGIGGSVTGLLGTVVVQNNGADTLSLAANGTFSFATPVAQGGAYAVTVLTPPAGQTCVVANASGMASATVGNVAITCTSVQHVIGGTVTGLLGTVVVQNNGADNLSLSADGAFSFAIPVAQGAAYTVTVLTQPAGQTCVVANASGTASAAVTNVSITCTSGGGLALFVGDMGGPGNVDGMGALARFTSPWGVATDSMGNMYLADAGNSTIRKITPAGVVTTFAGSAGLTGSTDGTGATARFRGACGVATDNAGNVYVADSSNNTIRKITPAGVVTTLAGSAGVVGSADGTGAAARFNGPRSVATDGAGNVYVADTANNTIRKITPVGAVSTFAGSAGPPPASGFNAPSGVATDSAGNVYVADTSNYLIRKITPAGTVSTLAGSQGNPGSADGSGALARFNLPEGVATDSAGNVYVADTGFNTFRKITPARVVSTLAGSAGVRGSADGNGAAASFFFPRGVAADSAGNVLVADSNNNTLRKITPAGSVSTLAGAVVISGNVDGTGAAARFDGAHGVATDGAGNVYVADSNNSTIRKITPAGTASTLAGSKGCFGSADGTGAAACFSAPRGLATDSVGNVYVADSNHSTIRKITPAGVVSTLAGLAGFFGYADNTGPAARFNTPLDVATDSAGNVYVVENSHAIRKITPAGVVSTFAGSASAFGSADGMGTAARFSNPITVATDRADNVYVVDSGNSTIRKITPAGVVSTLAGSPGLTGSVDGTGAAARFDRPNGLATDSTGNVYVADSTNHTLRKITPAGAVSTVVGVTGRQGFVPGPLPGVLSFPVALALSGSSLYLTMANGVARVQPVP